MNRSILEQHQFFSQAQDGTPYWVTWTPGDIEGRLTIAAADSDFEVWCKDRPEILAHRMEVVAHVGLEAWTEQQIEIRHQAHRIELLATVAAEFAYERRAC